MKSAEPQRPGHKSASAFRTISEVSSELEVPQHVLRFWETKFPQIRPLKRGGGRRYYRPEDVVLLRRIQTLLYKEGYTIKGVQRLLRESRAEAGSAGAPPAMPPEPTAATAAASDELAGDGRRTKALAEPAVPPRLTSEQRGRIQTVLTELRALSKLLRALKSGASE